MDKKYASQERYDAAHTTQIKLKLNDKTDEDLIVWLNTRGNKQGYIKMLIRNDMGNAAILSMKSQSMPNE